MIASGTRYGTHQKYQLQEGLSQPFGAWKYRRGCYQERRQALGVDLREVPRQDSARNKYALEHGPAQR